MQADPNKPGEAEADEEEREEEEEEEEEEEGGWNSHMKVPALAMFCHVRQAQDI